MSDRSGQDPPVGFRALVLFLAPQDLRDAIDGDLLEEFRDTSVPQRSRRAARNWYRLQVIRSLGALLTFNLTSRNLPRLLAGTLAALVFAILVPELLSHVAWRLGTSSSSAPRTDTIRILHLASTVLLAPVAGRLASWIARPVSLPTVVLLSALLTLPGVLIATLAPNLEPRWVAPLWVITVPLFVLIGGLWGRQPRRHA